MAVSPTIQEGLVKLFEQTKTYVFAKKTYEGLFKQTYQEYKPLFEEITSACIGVEDSDALVEEIASILPAEFHKQLKSEDSKRKRELLIMNSNTPLVTFIIPLLRYSRDAFAEDIVDIMVEKWNMDIPMKVQKATYEEIIGGFKYKLCYITTTICEHLQKPDDCYELNILRDYRDNYLMSFTEGQQLVSQYYDIAPTIVKRMYMADKPNDIYEEIYSNHLAPCVQAIERGENEACRQLYENMVHTLQNRYVHERMDTYEN